MRKRRGYYRVLASLAGVLLSLTAAGAALAQEPCRPPIGDRQRYGYVPTRSEWASEFDIALVNGGWAPYTLSNTLFPPDMDRAVLLRTRSGYQINPAQLAAFVDANPGAMWLVGNEPDCIYQDNVLAEEYARIYHDLYTFIKGRDALAQVAPGGIVQPTPLRLAYLDLVLASYRARYHHTLPADAWHIHNAILNEVNCDYYPDICWGADVPPGFDVPHGVLRHPDENDRLDLFQEQIWAFRQWMFDRGYGGAPLFVSEYGVLMPVSLGFTIPRVNQFMSATFAFMATATHPDLGDPADGFRLVQRWAWFSLDVPTYEQEPGGFNGNLFDPYSTQITEHGLNYAQHTASLAILPYVDLGLSTWDLPPVGRPLASGEQITYTVRVRIANVGTANAGPFFVDLAWDGPATGAVRHALPGLPSRTTSWAAFDLPGLEPGVYTLAVDVDPTRFIAEAAECNNHYERTLVIPSFVTYLPVIVLTSQAGTPAAAAQVALQAPRPSCCPWTGITEATSNTDGRALEKVIRPASQPAPVDRRTEEGALR